MDWTNADLSKLRHRRNNLLALITAIEARDVIASRRGGGRVSDNTTDLAKHKADLTEIDEILRRRGGPHTASNSCGKEAEETKALSMATPCRPEVRSYPLPTFGPSVFRPKVDMR